jgi:hypothetical protein
VQQELHATNTDGLRQRHADRLVLGAPQTAKPLVYSYAFTMIIGVFGLLTILFPSSFCLVLELFFL